MSYQYSLAFLSFVVGFSFFSAGLYMLKKQSIPLVFDGDKKVYFEDDKEYEFKVLTSFESIHAIQILSYSAMNVESHSARWCELNLVLNNGDRVYICSYNKQYNKVEK